MRKLLAAIFVVAIFAACAEAKASVALLTGAVHIANTGSFKVNHTVEYNAIYGNPASCEQAKTEAIEKVIETYPITSGVVYGNFNKVVTLTCTEKTLVE